jgi:signal transduction histidine kinase
VTGPRLTIRTRLTLLYSGLFAAGGAVLVVITYLLVAALPLSAAPTVTLPGGEVDVSTVRVADRASFEPVCRRALADKTADPQFRDKCVTAYRVWGAADQRTAMLDHLLRYSLATLAVVVLLAALAGWLVAGRALRPVHRITAAARAAAERDLSARVALTGPRDEMRELADTFDTMLGRLQTAFDSQERFIANASHELRTPLTVMRAAVDVVLAKPAPTTAELRGMARDVRVAVTDAERLVEALLTLARSDRALTVHEEIDLATVAEDVLDSAALGDRRSHAALAPAVGHGDPVLLERLVTNLVDNAVRHNVPGGELWVTTSTVDGRPTVTVANTGPPVPADEITRLFRPFHRRPDRTTGDGFGLGLAIVSAIAIAHRGTVTAEPRPGGGLLVTVAMPEPVTAA